MKTLEIEQQEQKEKPDENEEKINTIASNIDMFFLHIAFTPPFLLLSNRKSQKLHYDLFYSLTNKYIF